MLFAPTSTEYLPAEQSLQDDIEEAPTELEYVPALHGVHRASPAFEYVPATHRIHVLLELAPTWNENVPLGHEIQSNSPSFPSDAMYLPATQPKHSPPLGPEKPELHIHCDLATLPAGAFAFAVQR